MLKPMTEVIAMARVLLLCGSPRAGGNTDDCADRVARRLAAAGHDTQAVRVCDRRIEPCRGCRACMSLLHCVIEGDDFEGLWREVKDADLLVQAAPIYWYGPPGPMKNFIDRTHGCFALERPLAGLKAALLSVAGDSSCWEPHESILGCWPRYYGAAMLPGARVVAREKGDARTSKAVMAALDEWADSLGKALS
jgi:multimeric flavodoxin WrbA